MISHSELLELLHYDPVSGEFTWRVNRRKMLAGEKAGTLLEDGYVQIMIDYEHYSAHRLAWFYVHGQWPEMDLDHKNRNRSDNSLENLRLATDAQNQYNRAKLPNTHSKWKGVTFDKGREKCWKMSIRLPNGSTIQRRYEDEREAAEEYMFLALEHHGEFARFE